MSSQTYGAPLPYRCESRKPEREEEGGGGFGDESDRAGVRAAPLVEQVVNGMH